MHRFIWVECMAMVDIEWLLTCSMRCIEWYILMWINEKIVVFEPYPLYKYITVLSCVIDVWNNG